MKFAAAALALALTTGLVAPAVAQPQTAAAAKKYSVDSTPLLELMKNPATKPVLQKHLSDFYSMLEDNEGMIPPDFTLVALQDVAGQPTAEALKAIQADLDKL